MSPAAGDGPVEPVEPAGEGAERTASVRVWLLLGGDIGEAAADPRATSALDEAEMRRLSRFRRAVDADGFVAGRRLIRAMLAGWAGVPAGTLRFALAPNGKPAVSAPASARAFRFSITHTDGLVACAVSAAGEVGLDAERHDPAFEFGPVVRRFFAADDAAWLAGLPSGSRLAAFYDLWTVKEAVAKASGGDLAAALGRSVGRRGWPLTESVPILCQDDAGRPWQAILSRPTSAHSLALAISAFGAGRSHEIEVVRAASLAD